MVNALREVADRSQAPILRMLDSMGVSYQPFFIVNMIKVTGGRSLLQQLAARGGKLFGAVERNSRRNDS